MLIASQAPVSVIVSVPALNALAHQNWALQCQCRPERPLRSVEHKAKNSKSPSSHVHVWQRNTSSWRVESRGDKTVLPMCACVACWSKRGIPISRCVRKNQKLCKLQ